MSGQMYDKVNLDGDYTIKAFNSSNEIIDVLVGRCKGHCDEIIPRVGICADCNTEYMHVNTVENPETGFIHFVYECSGCPPAKRKAQKVIRITDGDPLAKLEKQAYLGKGFFN